MMEHKDQERLRNLIEHYGIHDVLLEVAVGISQQAARFNVQKRFVAAKRLEYISALLIRLCDDDMVQDTQNHRGRADDGV